MAPKPFLEKPGAVTRSHLDCFRSGGVHQIGAPHQKPRIAKPSSTARCAAISATGSARWQYRPFALRLNAVVDPSVYRRVAQKTAPFQNLSLRTISVIVSGLKFEP